MSILPILFAYHHCVTGELTSLCDPHGPFCSLQVKLGHIYYLHDSTESGEDSFTLSASAYEIERRSLPVTFTVTVFPVNDEAPKLTRNTGLEVLSCRFTTTVDY